EIAQLQEGGRGKPSLPSPPPSLPSTSQVPVITTEAIPEPETPATSLQPLPGEMLSEAERQEPAAPGLGGPALPAGPAAHDDYDRRGGRGRRDRDRRGKKPKIPSFESKSFEREVRTEGRPYTLEVLPGESLAKLSRRPEQETAAESEAEAEDKNAPLG